MKTDVDDAILSKVKMAFQNKEMLKQTIEKRMNGIVAERRKLLVRDLTKFFKL